MYQYVPLMMPLIAHFIGISPQSTIDSTRPGLGRSCFTCVMDSSAAISHCLTPGSRDVASKQAPCWLGKPAYPQKIIERKYRSLGIIIPGHKKGAEMCQVSLQRGKDVHSVRPGPRQTCWGRCYHHASDWFGSSWCFPCSTSQSTCKKMDKKDVLVPRINVQLLNIKVMWLSGPNSLERGNTKGRWSRREAKPLCVKVMWLSGPNSSGKQLTVSTDDMEMGEFLPWNHVEGISLHLRAIWGSPSKPTS